MPRLPKKIQDQLLLEPAPSTAFDIRHAGSTSLEDKDKWKLLTSAKPFRSPKKTIFRMHFVAGKGGLGKTTIIIMLASVAKTMRRHIEIFDLCSANPSSKRYYKLNDDRIRGSLDKDVIGEVIRDEIYPLLDSSSVLGDLGASAEIAFLDFIEESNLSELLDEQMVLHVPIGPLDSLGTAISIAQRAPHTPTIIYLNHREREIRMVVRDATRRRHLDNLLALPNIVGVAEIPELTAALTLCSRISTIPFDAQTSEQLTPIERAMCQGAMRRVSSVFAPFGAWLP